MRNLQLLHHLLIQSYLHHLQHHQNRLLMLNLLHQTGSLLLDLQNHMLLLNFLMDQMHLSLSYHLDKHYHHYIHRNHLQMLNHHSHLRNLHLNIQEQTLSQVLMKQVYCLMLMIQQHHLHLNLNLLLMEQTLILLIRHHLLEGLHPTLKNQLQYL